MKNYPFASRRSLHCDHADVTRRHEVAIFLPAVESSPLTDLGAVTGTVLAHRSSMSFNFALNHYGHLHRILVTSHVLGWEVVVLQDSTVIRRTYRADWHKVERDIRLFQMRMCACGADGWPVVLKREPAA